jgi:ribosomal protein S18 acetylase RimI-like enzyme
MTRVVLRTAAFADAGAIAALHVASWRDAFRGMIPDSVLDGPMLDERLPMWRQVLAIMPAGRLTLVAVDEAATAEAPIVGFASGGRRRGRERADLPYDAEIYTLYVAQARRGQNLGCRLMAAMAMRLQLFGHTDVMLWTLRDNAPGRAFYEALGGRAIAERDEWFTGAPLKEIGYGWPRIDGLLGACHDRLAMA